MYWKNSSKFKHLGDAYWQAGRYHEARFQWNRALSFDPTDELRASVEAKLNGQVPSTDPLVEN